MQEAEKEIEKYKAEASQAASLKSNVEGESKSLELELEELKRQLGLKSKELEDSSVKQSEMDSEIKRLNADIEKSNLKISELSKIEVVESKPPEGDELGRGYLELRDTSRNMEEQLANLQLIQTNLTGQLSLIANSLQPQ